MKSKINYQLTKFQYPTIKVEDTVRTKKQKKKR